MGEPDSNEQGTSRVVVACLAGIAAFQGALAAGAPLGVIAYGGSHPGVLPASLRGVSTVAALGWAAAATAVGSGWPRSRRGQRALLQGVAVTAGAGTVLNLASPSLPERLVWVPVTALLAGSALRAARRPSTAPLTA